MSSLDTDTVWKKLNRDPAFTNGMNEAAIEAFREIVDALPKILGDQLESKVTLSTLAKAKLDIVEYMLANGFVEKLVPLALTAIPEEMRPDAGEMIEGLKDAFKQLRMPMMEMIHDVSGFLETNGLTERDALVSGMTGLNAKSLKAYDKGTLTIGSLLETQPAVLLANG